MGKKENMLKMRIPFPEDRAIVEALPSGFQDGFNTARAFMLGLAVDGSSDEVKRELFARYLAEHPEIQEAAQQFEQS